NRSGLLGPLENQIDATGALRIPLVGFIGALVLEALFLVDAADAGAAARRGREPIGATPLMSERGHRDLPSFVDLADQVLDRHFGIGEEDLVERRVAVHLPQLLNIDPGLFDLDHEERETFVLRRVPIGPRQQKPVIGVMGAGGPYFLAVDDPEVAVQLGAGRRAGEIRTAARLAEELAPGIFAGEDTAQELLFLLIGTVFKERGGGEE